MAERIDRCPAKPEGAPSVDCALPAGHEGLHRDANFTLLWGRPVVAHLAGLGQDIAERRPSCHLRVVSLPGMTAALFVRACHEAGVAVSVLCFDGQRRSIWPKLGDVSGASWWKIYRAAERLLGKKMYGDGGDD